MVVNTFMTFFAYLYGELEKMNVYITECYVFLCVYVRFDCEAKASEKGVKILIHTCIMLCAYI